MTPISTATRSAAVIAIGLGTMTGVRLLTGPPEQLHERILMVSVAATLLVMGQRLWAGGSLESRLICAGLAGATLVGTVLDLTLGLPGSEPAAPGLASAARLAAGTAIPALLLLDASLRRPERMQHPYPRSVARPDPSRRGR